MEAETFETTSEDETAALGKAFAQRLHKGDTVALLGDLGSGKTEFVKGICRHFNVEDIVTSPTFTVINQYQGETIHDTAIKIYHVDLYRIDSVEDLSEIGFDECAHSNDAIKLIEWAEKASGALPADTYSVKFSMPDEDENLRLIEIRHGDADRQDSASTLFISGRD